MELPRDVIGIIKEYSMPITNPKWRTLRIMTNPQFYLELIKLKDLWWENDKRRRHRTLLYDTLMRRYILRYRIHLLAEFEWS
jgi:hypothetical protein